MSESIFLRRKNFYFMTIILGYISLNFSASLIILPITITQVIYLISLLIRKKYYKYYIMWIFFTITSFEITYGQESNSFNFRHLSIMGVNISFITLTLFLIVVLLKKRLYAKTEKYYSVFKLIILIFGISFIVGIFNLFKGNLYINFFIRDFYYGFLVLALFIVTYFIFKSYFDISYLKEIFIIIISATVPLAVISIFFGVFDIYSGGKLLRTLTPFFFSPLLILFSIDKRIRSEKVFLFISGIVSIFINIVYLPSGKGIIISVGVIVFYLILYIKRNKGIVTNIVVVLISLAIILSINKLINDIKQNNQILHNKVSEVTSMIDYFLGKKDLSQVSKSPAYRIAEFQNIVIENFENPINLIVGKGMGGTFKDHLKFFTEYKSAFSYEEYVNNSITRPHEALNYIFLKNGLLGIIIMILINIKIIKTFKFNYFGIIGLVWFNIFYSYSNNMAIIGVVALFLALSPNEKLAWERGKIK